MKQLSEQESYWFDFIKKTDVKTLIQGTDENGESFLKHVFKLHIVLFGETCTACANKIAHYINRIKNVNIEKMNNTKSLFKLKKGVIIPVLGSSEVYSEHNITDPIAKKLLKENPNRISLFQSYPKDWNKSKKSTNKK